MLSQSRTNDVGGRPEKLTGLQKNRLRIKFRKWVEKEAARLDVSHMTVRRALQNEKASKENAA